MQPLRVLNFQKYLPRIKANVPPERTGQYFVFWGKKKYFWKIEEKLARRYITCDWLVRQKLLYLMEMINENNNYEEKIQQKIQ